MPMGLARVYLHSPVVTMIVQVPDAKFLSHALIKFYKCDKSLDALKGISQLKLWGRKKLDQVPFLRLQSVHVVR